MDQFVLLGDSITQAAFSEAGTTFGPRLLHDYVRKLDVVNRGFSGYNTTQILKLLPRIITPPKTARMRVVGILLGANDASLPNTGPGPDQNVDLEQYTDNLAAIVKHPALQAHEGVRVLLITPPPLHEGMCFAGDQAKYGTDVVNSPRRTAFNARQYAEACKTVAKHLEVPVVDLWSAILREGRYDLRSSGGNPPGSLTHEAWYNERLSAYLSDGLHLTSAGYAVLYRELTRTIDEEWPDLIPENMRPTLPNWDDQAAWAG